MIVVVKVVVLVGYIHPLRRYEKPPMVLYITTFIKPLVYFSSFSVKKTTTRKMSCDKMKDGTVEELNLYTDQYYEIKELETDNSNFSKELTSLTI